MSDARLPPDAAHLPVPLRRREAPVRLHEGHKVALHLAIVAYLEWSKETAADAPGIVANTKHRLYELYRFVEEQTP